jgi:hypothetical protein
MLSIDRLPFPRRYKVKQTLILLVILAGFLGLWLKSRSQAGLRERVIIRSVNFEAWGQQYVEVGYDIENTGRKDEKVNLLVRVYDKAGEEITSSMFQTIARAGVKAHKSHQIIKMRRTLKEGEAPHKATLEVYGK